jgi:GPI mannosyltransferase 3
MARRGRSSRHSRAHKQKSYHKHSYDPLKLFLFLLAFRLLNALLLRTFFQPDEYFQSLEPAWQLAFGPDTGAWLTWVSSEPNVLLACIYDSPD